MKPHIRFYCVRWRCSGPREITHLGTFYDFPWAYGDTPAEAYAAWKKLQKRPTPTSTEKS